MTPSRSILLIGLCFWLLVHGTHAKPKRFDLSSRTRRHAESDRVSPPRGDYLFARPKRIQERAAPDNDMNLKPKQIQLRSKRGADYILKPKRMDIVH